jgi:type IV secretory pathway VirB4 component
MARLTRRRPPPGRGAEGGVPGPDSIQVLPGAVRAGGWHAATLAVTGYPFEVGPGWLEPLTSYPGRLDVSVHIEPVPPAIAAAQLRRQRARLESGRRLDADRGRLDDPGAEAAAGDARDLAYRIARGEGRLFRAGVYLTIWAPGPDELASEVASVRALAESLLLSVQPATFRSLQGWITCLPLAADQLRMRRVFDTAALAASFPFASPDLPPPGPAAPAGGGVLYGVNAASPGVVCWDRWAQDNHNSVIIGRSGSGKSYLAKLDILRSLYQGVQVSVIDPEDEYARLAEATGGTCVRPGAAGVRLNPFDLPARARTGQARPDELIRRALFAHTFTAVLLGDPLDSAQRAALDDAIMGAYQRAGITTDPRTWSRPAPLLPGLAAALRDTGSEAGRDLAARLAPYTGGTHSAMFSGPATTRPGGHLVVWSLRDLPEELKAPGILLALDAIWQQVSGPDRRRRLVAADEAWLLMRQPDGARFLFRMAKAARKHWAALMVITQDAEDVLGSDLGRAVISNAATQILLRQAPQAIDLITGTFRLSAGEREFLLTARQGEGLLAAGPADRVAFRTVASDFEHQLATTSPEFLANLEAEGRNPGVDPL